MLSLLFVDDEPNVLAGLRRMLRSQRRQWEMNFCDSGESALQWLASHRADAIVSDMRMPGMDGAELLSRVRETYPDTIRIVLSGHSDQEMTLRSIGPAHQYLSKPCDPEQLKAKISSTLDLHQRIRSAEVRRAVESTDSLPILPAVYTELVAEMNDPAGSIESAGRIISQDLGMSAKVLQLINSSFFGLPVRVTDVPHAVSLLGLEVIRPLVLSTATFSQFEKRELGGLSLAKLTAHSTRVAMLASKVAEYQLPQISANALGDVVLAGLMHDVGRLLLAGARPEEYEQIVHASGSDPTLVVQREQDLFGVTHAEVGGYLLQLWGLPTELVEAVAMHHTPASSHSDAFGPLAAVHTAEALTDGEVELDETYLERVGLDDVRPDWRVGIDSLKA